MQIPFVVFRLSDGVPVRAGNCQDDKLSAQAGEGERALATDALTVDGLRMVIWEQTKAKRDAVIDGGAASALGVVDSDAPSRSNISGAVLGALIAQSASAPFTIEWTAKDNSVHTLDAAQMIALGLAVLSHVNAAHDNARALRSEIEAAADVSTLLSIDIEAGWP